jgi:hypothetical protein
MRPMIQRLAALEVAMLIWRSLAWLNLLLEHDARRLEPLWVMERIDVLGNGADSNKVQRKKKLEKQIHSINKTATLMK